MKKKLKYLLPILCVIAAIAALTLAAAAATETGSCGTDLTYTLDTETGVLTISGVGAMTDFYAATPAPWSSYAADVRAVKLEEGVTTLGNIALKGCVNLKSLSLPTTLTEIGTGNLPAGCPMWLYAAAGEICVDGWLLSYKGATPQDLRLSEGIRGMANGVFAMDGVKTAVLPRSLLYAGKDTFLFCNTLTDVTILNPDCIFTDAMGSLPFPANTTLHGYKDSTTEVYASMYGNPFVALGSHTHVWGGITTDTPATCTTDGEESRHCTVPACAARTDIRVIPRTGHSGAWRIVREPTADQPGEKQRICAVCGAEETRATYVSKLGDINNDDRISKADLLLLQKLLAGWQVEVDSVAVDINGDGRTGKADLLLLQKRLAGWPVKFGADPGL